MYEWGGSSMTYVFAAATLKYYVTLFFFAVPPSRHFETAGLTNLKPPDIYALALGLVLSFMPLDIAIARPLPLSLPPSCSGSAHFLLERFLEVSRTFILGCDSVAIELTILQRYEGIKSRVKTPRAVSILCLQAIAPLYFLDILLLSLTLPTLTA